MVCSKFRMFRSLIVIIAFAVLGMSAAAQDNPFKPQPAPALPAGMTGSNTNDPRNGLKAGMYDAGEAAFGMRHLTMVKKPTAFQIPTTDPTDPKLNDTIVRIGMGDPAQMPPSLKLVLAGLGFGNSDMAFSGNRLFMGNFYGMSIYDISDPVKTSLLTTLVCPGGQGDVSVYGNLMFMSVEMSNGRVDCGTQGFPLAGPDGPAASKDRFRGVRIFDITDIKQPRQVAAVQTCRGSHTHTLVTDPRDKTNVYIYVSGTSFVRPAEELEGCSAGPPSSDPNTALFRIEVIKVPVAAPQTAKIVSTPRLFMDARTGVIDALTNAGSHEDPRPAATDQCHDITVYPEFGLAAGACSGNGILLDIKDPANPKRVDAVNDPNYAYWHSAAFSNDGRKVVFTDEWGGGLAARCRASDPNKWGANSIFDLEGGKLKFASYYKMPAAQSDTENCVAHNGSLVPVPGRDIKVQAWYQGGISVMDFTDARNPVEIAYFDRGPVDADTLVSAGYWSAYWYNGNVYASEISRGLDVFELQPTKFLTRNEIDAARLVRMGSFNVQHQERIAWPKNLVVAKAYLDQLERSGGLSEKLIKDARTAVLAAEASGLARKDRKELSAMSKVLNRESGAAKSTSDQMRVRSLAEVLRAPKI